MYSRYCRAGLGGELFEGSFGAAAAAGAAPYLLLLLPHRLDLEVVDEERAQQDAEPHEGEEDPASGRAGVERWVGKGGSASCAQRLPRAACKLRQTPGLAQAQLHT